MLPGKPKELRFPSLGYSDAIDGAQLGAFMTPAAVNVIGGISGSAAFKGGTRPGIARLSDATFASPEGVFTIPWNAEDGTQHVTIAVVDGGELKVVDGSVVASTTGLASSDSGNYIVTDDDKYIVFSAAPSVVSSGRSIGCVSDGKLYFRSGNGVKCYNPMTGVTEEVVADALGATAMRFWRGRLVLFGANGAIHFSAVMEHGDFDSGAHYERSDKATDIVLAEAGAYGDRVTAFVPLNDGVAFAATRNSLWRLEGDAIGGALRNISRYNGIVSDTAWSIGADGQVAFMSENGIHYVREDGYVTALDAPLENGMRKSVAEFSNPSSATKTWMFSYDRTMKAHIVCSRETASGTTSCWLIDDSRSIWPTAFASGKNPVALAQNRFGVALPSVILACSDGKLRSFSMSATDDDGSAIVNAVAIGPIMFSTGLTTDSVLAELLMSIDDRFTQYGPNVSIVVGKTADEVKERSQSLVEWIKGGCVGTISYEAFRCVANVGWNHTVRPRVRGNAFAVILWGTRWGNAEITSISRGCGRIR